MAKSSALSWIVREAKRIKKQYPKRFSKWTDYVAQASAIYAKKHKGKSPVGKKRKAETKRSVGKRKSVNGVKTQSRSHTDKNRITANIQVGSFNSDNINRLKSLTASLASYENKKRSMAGKKHIVGAKTYNTVMRQLANNIASLRKQISEVKKNIK